MRVAFFSPLPPARTGIADYSAALLEHLRPLVDVEVFSAAPVHFNPGRYDALLYQLGNNPHHGFVYEAAMVHPGIVVLHEANLHHLIASLTIRRGDWDAYLREVELDGGPAALAFARDHVRTLQRGPDYDVPLLHSVLARARAVIVHSDAVADVVRARGFNTTKIPHGAWIGSADRAAYRARLGLDESHPLVGILGFLKPYKRIAESLRAFHRVAAEHPRARMILVGELHPGLRLDPLGACVRHLDFPSSADFNGYLAACDIVMNLRYPTVGETSGTFLRALGMGKPVIISDVGSFREYPDDVCLKTPVDAAEEEYLVEYLKLLIEHPKVTRELGSRARAYVERECSWPSVARRYADVLNSPQINADAHR